MTLRPGTRFGAYEVVGEIGTGGMGRVFKARDTRVDRLVAIKVLHPAVLNDLNAESRLEREARALASLNHPRICSLFEFTRQGGHALLIMELIEGQSLAERLSRGKLRPNEALRIGIEIADGLAAAHRAGIVHRDLKPGNVMLTKSGAKLLDFGIAKTRPEPIGGNDPTRQQLTGDGALIGTVPFMAPEQLDGRGIDHRTDIWAFGCVLYELLTGRRAFAGPTAAAAAAAILERDPPAVSDVEPTVDAAIDRVVRKCLSRDPDRRWQSAADLCDELEWLSGRGASPSHPDITAPHSAWRNPILAAGALAAIGIAVLLVSRPWSAPQPAAAPPRQFELTVPRLSAVESIALSPDAANLAFIARGASGLPAVWVRSLVNGTVRALPGTEGAVPASPPIWSPGGDAIAFVSERKLRRVTLSDGQVQAIADVQGQIFGGDWRSDGTLLVGTYQFSTDHGIHRVPAAGGRLTPVTDLGEDALLHASPRMLPDGRRFVFLKWSFDERARDLCVAALDDPKPRCLGVNAYFFAGLTETHVLYAREGTLFAHWFNAQNGSTSGEPMVVAERVAQDRLGRVGVSAVGSGTLVYQAAAAEVRQLVIVNRSGVRQGAVGDPAVQDGFDADASGATVVVERPADDGSHLWLVDPARGVTTSIDTGRETASSPVLSPDGRLLTYLTQRDGRSVIVERPTHGGPSRVLFEYRGEGVLYLADRSRDGRQTLVGIAERNRRVAELISADGGKPVVVGEGALSLATPRLSPDVRLLAYVAAQSQVYVSPIPPTGEQWQVSTSGGDQPQWRGDGRELFYVAPGGVMMAASVTTTPRFEVKAPHPLFKTDLLTDLFNQRFVVTTDGNRFLLNSLREGDQAATTTTLQVLLNWPETVRR